MGSDRMRSNVVVFVCASSAGIHAALAPQHFDEGTAAGLGFAVSAGALAVLAVVLARNPTSRPALAAAAALLAGLLVAYALAVTTGVPILHPGRESLERVALATKAIEIIGLAAAAALLLEHQAGDEARSRRGVSLALLAVVGLVSAFLAVELSAGHGGHGDHEHGDHHEHGGSPSAHVGRRA